MTSLGSPERRARAHLMVEIVHVALEVAVVREDRVVAHAHVGDWADEAGGRRGHCCEAVELHAI